MSKLLVQNIGRLQTPVGSFPHKGKAQGENLKLDDAEVYVEDGISMNEAHTSFASSTSPIDRMVRHLIFDTRLPLDDVLRMSSATPAKLLGIYDRKGSIAVGKDADINLADANFNVVRTICKGKDGKDL